MKRAVITETPFMERMDRGIFLFFDHRALLFLFNQKSYIMDIEFNDMFDSKEEHEKTTKININSLMERVKDIASIKAQNPKINTYNRLKFFVEVDDLPDLPLETSFWLDFRLTNKGIDIYTNPLGYKSPEDGLRKEYESLCKDRAYWEYDFILNTLPEHPKLFS